MLIYQHVEPRTFAKQRNCFEGKEDIAPEDDLQVRQRGEMQGLVNEELAKSAASVRIVTCNCNTAAHGADATKKTRAVRKCTTAEKSNVTSRWRCECG